MSARAAPFPLRRVLRVATIVAAAAAVSGCISLEPKYARPAPAVPAALPQGGAYGTQEPAQVQAADLPWRDFFTDPKLQGVIQLALEHNQDLKIAVQNILEARAQYRVQRSALFPEVDASASATYEHTPFGFGSVSTVGSAGASGTGSTGTGTGGAGGGASSGLGGSGASAGQASAGSGSEFIRIYTADLGVNAYELDFWGRVRSLTKQALQQYLATEAGARTTRITLISEVATDYVTYSADALRLKVSRDSYRADYATLKITQARFNAGIASELDVRQAESAAQQARAGIATYTTQLAQDVNALTLLVGAPVPADLVPAPQDDSLPTLADLPAGLSSTVLLRRPDVVQAEHQLIAYNANIGAARAAFFPKVTITGSGGTISLSFSNLFGPNSGNWSVGPSISLPIFDGGQRRANLAYAKAERDAAVSQYEKTVQTAFREVADQLAQRGTIGEQLAAQQGLVFADDRYLTLASARYQRGADTYLNVLTAQVNLYNAQLTLASARLTRATNLISLYQTLGGGVR